MSVRAEVELCHRRFEAVVRRSPEANAVVMAEQAITYAELDGLADMLAERLVRAGAAPEALVGVLIDRSVELVAAALAAWKAGAAYLALDAHAPRRHLVRIMTNARPIVVITQQRLRHLVPDGVETITVDGLAPANESTPANGSAATSGAEPSSERCDPAPENPAAVIYTSGSTGDSKGVVLSHRALLSSYRGWVAAYDLEGRPRTYLQAAGFGFDVATADLLRTLLSGGTLALCTQQMLLDPPRLHDAMRRAGVDSLEITPTLLRHLVRWADESGTDLSYLTLIVAGGERFTRADLDLTRRVTGSAARLVNTFGLTEGAIDSTYYVAVDDEVVDDTVPVGSEFATTRCLVRDGYLGAVDDGDVGEACIAGPQLARCYLHNPRLTAERFLPDPTGAPGERLYATGDLMRRRSDGRFDHVGRIDDQVKIRGVRINLSDVEAALRRLPRVRSAAVVAPEIDAQRELAAWVLADRADVAGIGPSETDVRVWLLREFPSALVPRHVAVVDSLPLSATGKVDRQELTRRAVAALAAPAPSAARDDVAAAGTRSVVAAAWAEVLGRPAATEHEDFFESGGTSLIAAHLVALLAQRCATSLPAGALLTSPTVVELTTLIEGLRREDAAAIPADVTRTTAPLAPLQRGLWAHHVIEPHSVAYNVPLLLAIDGRLDRDRLQQALDHLVARHDALRLRIPAGAAVLEDDPGSRLSLECVDLRGCRDVEAAADAWARDRSRRPIALTVAPLASAALLRLGEQSWRLLLVLHHLICDGVSVRVLLEDLGGAYRSRPGETADTPDGGVRYLDYAAWQHAQWTADHDPAGVTHWRDYLLGAPPPPPLPDPVPPAHTGIARRSHRIAARHTAALRELARELRCSLFVTMLAAFAVLEHRWSGSTDVVIGIPVGERTVPGTRRCVGFFVRTVPLRVHVDPGENVGRLIRRVRAEFAESYRRDDVPFDVVLDQLRPDRGSTPLFRSWFNMLGEPDPVPDFDAARARMLAPPVVGALFDVNLYVTERDDILDVELVHDRTRLDDAHAAALLEQYAALLNRIVENPDILVGAVRLAAVPDLAPPEPIRTPPSLPARLDAARRGDPTAPAIRAAGRTVSNGELGAWIADLTDRLRAAGVGAGDAVALLGRRASGLPAALLACLALRAPFVLLDREDPVTLLARRVDRVGARAMLVVDPDALEDAPEAAAGPDRETAVAAEAALPVLRTGQPPAAAPGPSVAEPEELADGACYVMFTSATTGPGRGVLGVRTPLDHFVDWYVERFAITSSDRVSLLSGLAHDPVLRDVLVPLAIGATVCVPPERTRAAPLQLVEWLAAERVTVAHMTPALARLVASVPGARLPELRLLVLAGDAVVGRDLAAMRHVAPAATLVNGYGCTETPQLVSLAEFEPGAPLPAADARADIGSPAPGTRLEVTSAGGAVCAVGEVGELVVCSDHLARGYLDPHDEGGFARAVDEAPRYATGDLGRRRPDGAVVVLGRRDSQVKIAGHRVELDEVDALLRRLVAPADCATISRTGPAGDLELVSFVAVGGPGTGAVALDEAQLRHAMRRELPAYHVPRQVIALPALPLTRTGKLDRAALAGRPTPDTGRQRPPPVSDLESEVAAVWSSVLGCGVVDRDTTFFDAGGSSLSLARVQLALAERLDRIVDVLTLLECPTIRQLSARLADGSHRPLGTANRRLPPATSPTSYLIAPALRRYLDASRRLEVRRHSRLEAAP